MNACFYHGRIFGRGTIGMAG